MEGGNVVTKIPRQRGFTLIELMIVLVIVAVLAAVAVPSYRSYVLRSHRSDAKTALLALATAEEKFYLQCNTYANTLGTANACATTTVAFPTTSEKGWYTLSITSASATDFTVRATTVAGGGQADDTDCSWYQVNGGGVKTASGTDCWN